MNKVSIIALLTCASFAPVAMAQGSNGLIFDRLHGVVNFHGAVTTNSCKISTGDKNKNVYLPPVAASDIHIDYTSNPTIPFSIKVENCGPVLGMSPKIAIWDNSGNTVGDGYITNTSDKDSGIALFLTGKDNKLIDVRRGSLHEGNVSGRTVSNDENIYSFNVGYIKLNRGDVKKGYAGQVTAQVNYQVVYW